jgi:hypothetical protein
LEMPPLQPLVRRANEFLARPVEIKFYEMLSAVAR